MSKQWRCQTGFKGISIPKTAPFALIPFTLPKFMTILGFGKAGITSKSIASYIQSLIGNVKVGSLFSKYQSIGAKGGFETIEIPSVEIVLAVVVTYVGYKEYKFWQKNGRWAYKWKDMPELFE